MKLCKTFRGAHRDRSLMIENILNISKNLQSFKEMSDEEILSQRKNKFLKIGREKGFISNPESLSAHRSNLNNLNNLFKSKKNISFLIGGIVVVILSLIAITL